MYQLSVDVSQVTCRLSQLHYLSWFHRSLYD